MAARRLWVLIALAVLTVLAALSLARAAEESVPATDFLVLAVKPEGEVKDFRMIPVGESSVDPARYREVVESLPRSLFGGVMVRPHDERAELAQCRTACAANAKCANFTYVRPGKGRPVGVCHLRRAVEPALVAAPPAPVASVAAPPAPTVTMPPIVESPAPAPEVMVVSPLVRTSRKLVTIDSTRNGQELYKGEQAPSTPITFKFKTPVSSAKAAVKTAGKARVWANIEALDAKGRVFKRSGMWVAADGAPHQLLVRTDSNRIGALRITSREDGALIAQGVDFVRAGAEAPDAVVAETAPGAEAPPADVAEEDVPPPPVPDAVAEAFPLPPRAPAVATDAPVDIAQAPQEPEIHVTPLETQVAELPANGTQETTISIPIAPADTPAVPSGPATTSAAPAAAPQPQPDEELFLLAAAGAVVLGLGGMGLYRQSYQRRQLARLTTRVVSEGLDRHTVSITTDGQPDLSLRYHIRMPADVSARTTKIVIIPDGVAA
jgi:hypothetical protein